MLCFLLAIAYECVHMYMSQGRKKDGANNLTINLKHLINEIATMTQSYFFRARFFYISHFNSAVQMYKSITFHMFEGVFIFK